MKSKDILVAAAIALLIAGAGGGFVAARSIGDAGSLSGPGGAFARLTDAERRQLQSMTEEERAAFFEEKGVDMPVGGPRAGDTVGGPGGRGPGLLEGTVAALDDETITVELTAGGSQNAFLDDETVIAAEDGAHALAVGSSVMVSTTPEADGVRVAQLVVVLK